MPCRQLQKEFAASHCPNCGCRMHGHQVHANSLQVQMSRKNTCLRTSRVPFRYTPLQPPSLLRSLPCATPLSPFTMAQDHVHSHVQAFERLLMKTQNDAGPLAPNTGDRDIRIGHACATTYMPYATYLSHVVGAVCPQTHDFHTD